MNSQTLEKDLGELNLLKSDDPNINIDQNDNILMSERENNLINLNNRPKTKLKFYKCSFQGCEMIFNKQCILRDHLRSHNKEKPWVCSFEGCGKSFTQSGNLKIHMLSHTKGRIYKCSFSGCDRGFTAKSYLKVI